MKFREFYNFLPASSKRFYAVSAVAMVAAHLNYRSFLKEYSWRQTFSLAANAQHLKDHKVRYTVLFGLGAVQMVMQRQAQRDLLTSIDDTRRQTNELLDKLTRELVAYADDLGVDIEDIDLDIKADESLEGLSYEVDYDDLNTEVINDADKVVRALIAPCGCVAGVDTTDAVPGFCRNDTEAEQDKANGFTERLMTLSEARISPSCDHTPRWGVNSDIYV